MKQKHKAAVILHVIMSLILLFGAGVQYNDPDGIWWMLIYLGAASSSILWLINRYVKILSIVVLIASIIWLILLLPDVVGQGTFNTHMFDSFTMHSIGIEEAREVGGLGIIAIWMAVTLFILPGKND